MRAAGISALNAWHKEIGMAPFIEAEVIFGALSTENPTLRTEVRHIFSVIIVLLFCIHARILIIMNYNYIPSKLGLLQKSVVRKSGTALIQALVSFHSFFNVSYSILYTAYQLLFGVHSIVAAFIIQITYGLFPVGLVVQLVEYGLIPNTSSLPSVLLFLLAMGVLI